LNKDGKYYLKDIYDKEIPLFDTDIIYVPKPGTFTNTANGLVNTGPLKQIISSGNVYINKVIDYYDKFVISDNIPDGYCVVASNNKMLEGIIRKQQDGYFFTQFGEKGGMQLRPNHVIFKPTAKYNQVGEENEVGHKNDARIPLILKQLEQIINGGKPISVLFGVGLVHLTLGKFIITI
jgi:hypothetical protein